LSLLKIFKPHQWFLQWIKSYFWNPLYSIFTFYCFSNLQSVRWGQSKGRVHSTAFWLATPWTNHTPLWSRSKVGASIHVGPRYGGTFFSFIETGPCDWRWFWLGTFFGPSTILTLWPTVSQITTCPSFTVISNTDNDSLFLKQHYSFYLCATLKSDISNILVFDAKIWIFIFHSYISTTLPENTQKKSDFKLYSNLG